MRDAALRDTQSFFSALTKFWRFSEKNFKQSFQNLNDFLRSFKQTFEQTDNQQTNIILHYVKLYLSSSSCGKLYGHPMTHSLMLLWETILSAVNSPTCCLLDIWTQSWVIWLFNTFIIRDFFEFTGFIRWSSFQSRYISNF